MTMQSDELKALRKAAGLTQAALAEALDMHRVTIGDMERGAAAIERRTELAVRYVVERAVRFARETQPASATASNAVPPPPAAPRS